MFRTNRKVAEERSGCIAEIRTERQYSIVRIIVFRMGEKFMMASTHRLGGIAAGTVMAVILHTNNIYESGLLLSAAVLGSIVPDIDNRNSSISRRYSFVSLLVTVGQSVIRCFAKLLPRKQENYIKSLIGHRGITHSMIPVILIPGFLIGIGYGTGYGRMSSLLASGLGVGILSHLLFDMFAGGVPLLLPFTTKRVYLAKIKTGGTIEWIFRGLLVVILIYFGLEVIEPWQKLLQL